MKYTGIAIIGGGLAGSIAGIATIPVDLHAVDLSDFRVEKLGGETQLACFRTMGLADSVLRKAPLDGGNWIARFGHVLDMRPSRGQGRGGPPEQGSAA